MKKQLKDLVTLVGGYAFKSNLYNDSGIRVIRIANVQDGYISDEYPCFYPEEYQEDIGTAMLEENDLLMSLTGNVGRVAFLTNDMLPAGLNQRVECLRTNNVLLKRYLYFFFRSKKFINEAIKNSSGIAQLNMSTKWLGEYEVTLFDEDKLAHICDELELINNTINNKQYELNVLDEIIKSRFIEMFGDPRDNKTNLMKIGEIGDLNSGGTPSRNNLNYFKGTIPWLTAGELNDLYVEDSIEHITQEAINNSSAKIFRAGTLMIGMYDTAAFKMSILKNDSASNQACANLAPKSGFNIIWLFYVLDFLKPVFLNERQGVRQKNLSLTKIKSFDVPVAKYELQNEFAEFVKLIDKLKFNIQKQIDLLQELLDKKMDEYFKD